MEAHFRVLSRDECRFTQIYVMFPLWSGSISIAVVLRPVISVSCSIIISDWSSSVYDPQVADSWNNLPKHIEALIRQISEIFTKDLLIISEHALSYLTSCRMKNSMCKLMELPWVVLLAQLLRYYLWNVSNILYWNRHACNLILSQVCQR